MVSVSEFAASRQQRLELQEGINADRIARTGVRCGRNHKLKSTRSFERMAPTDFNFPDTIVASSA